MERPTRPARGLPIEFLCGFGDRDFEIVLEVWLRHQPTNTFAQLIHPLEFALALAQHSLVAIQYHQIGPAKARPRSFVNRWFPLNWANGQFSFKTRDREGCSSLSVHMNNELASGEPREHPVHGMTEWCQKLFSPTIYRRWPHQYLVYYRYIRRHCWHA